MNFIIDADFGDSIVGWLTPDNPSATPKLIVIVPGRPPVEVTANVMRDGIRDLGLHSTGLVGFKITNDIIPDLINLDEILIIESETRLPIYGRFQKERHIKKKLFLFDCSIVPPRNILDSIKPHFSLFYTNSERYSLETAISMITNPFNESIFITGRTKLAHYDHYLVEKGYTRAALLRDPFEELAERLILLNYISKMPSHESAQQYIHGITGLIDFARTLSFNNLKSLRSSFRSLDDKISQMLMSPMTKVFACETGDPPTRADVSKSLDNLARLEVVGTRERYELFKEILAGALNDDLIGEQMPLSSQAVVTLAEKLSCISAVSDILGDDLALYSYVDEAVSEGLEKAKEQLSYRNEKL